MDEQVQNNIEFQIGELTGQMSSLITTVNALSALISSLDMRLRNNEKDTTVLGVKMGILGVIAGAVGSFTMSLILKVV